MSISRLKCAIDFQFIGKGIHVAGKCYPILKMEWVEAPTLLKFLAINPTDRERSRRLSESFFDICVELRNNKIAHGDLQHGNLLVSGSTIKIIDYDGMCVPGTNGLDSVENGLPHYQHPRRNGGKLTFDLDHFSTLVVWTSLYALSLDPSLWQQHIGDSERLLFQQSDFSNPQASSIFKKLDTFKDARLTKAVSALRGACFVTDLGKIPHLADVLMERVEWWKTEEPSPTITELVPIPVIPWWKRWLDALAPSRPRPATTEVQITTATDARLATPAVKSPTWISQGPTVTPVTPVTLTPVTLTPVTPGTPVTTQALSPAIAPIGAVITSKVMPLVRWSVQELAHANIGDSRTVDMGRGAMLELRGIPAGSFTTCGSKVTLARSFWLGKTEVTQEQWRALMVKNPSCFKDLNLPVENVSWIEAMIFCDRLNGTIPLPPRWQWALPTEEQWEYACRAGTTGQYAGKLDEMAWYSKNSDYGTHPVATKKPNAWGLYDLHGNVMEWCKDRHGSDLTSAITDPTEANSGAMRVTRGGSWVCNGSGCSSDSGRRWFLPNYRSNRVGFRVAAVTAGA
ncbi:MAG: SUMF1/EgtB/PvdO family nonheme iron enzyme [Deltaproteobacteria bacterium]